MLSAGEGKERCFKFVCHACREDQRNELLVEAALDQWQIERGHTPNES
jgi:hypothetical protein